jgi:hypothetical protein
MRSIRTNKISIFRNRAVESTEAKVMLRIDINVLNQSCNHPDFVQIVRNR